MPDEASAKSNWDRYSVTMRLEFIVCPDCYALVPTAHERGHADWHWMTNTSIEALAQPAQNDGRDDD